MSNETAIQTELYPVPLEKITPELITALCKAQAEFSPALKDSKNPYFNSNYAPLDAIWNACKGALAANELFVSQPTYMQDGKTILVTKVYHSSGGFISSEIQIVVSKQNDPQAFGSALTYFRRYELSAILGIVTDDDDAEGATSRDKKEAAPVVQKANEEQRQTILSLLKNPAQSEEDVKKITGKLPSMSGEEALKTIQYLKKKIALAAEAAAKEKAS